MLAVTVNWSAPFRTTYVQLQPADAREADLPPYGGTRAGGGPTGGVRAAPPLSPKAPLAQAPGPPADSVVVALPAMPPVVPVAGPQPGDGRLWVSPRPALPAAVAGRLYGDSTERDAVAVGRLRAMVDSLNVLLDEEQRARRLPAWTTEVAGAKFGIDSQFIHVAGIKIPTMALALLPISLPEGNYDEAMRSRQLQAMREDLLRSARRAQTFDDFRRYVRELRARKQAERDAERRARERPDTIKAVP